MMISSFYGGLDPCSPGASFLLLVYLFCLLCMSNILSDLRSFLLYCIPVKSLFTLESSCTGGFCCHIQRHMRRMRVYMYVWTCLICVHVIRHPCVVLCRSLYRFLYVSYRLFRWVVKPLKLVSVVLVPQFGDLHADLYTYTYVRTYCYSQVCVCWFSNYHCVDVRCVRISISPYVHTYGYVSI